MVRALLVLLGVLTFACACSASSLPISPGCSGIEGASCAVYPSGTTCPGAARCAACSASGGSAYTELPETCTCASGVWACDVRTPWAAEQGHVVVEAAELLLVLEGIELRGSVRRTRWIPTSRSQGARA